MNEKLKKEFMKIYDLQWDKKCKNYQIIYGCCSLLRNIFYSQKAS